MPRNIFELQRNAFMNNGGIPVAKRKTQLKKLRKIILENRTRIKQALAKDYGKHPLEVDLTEIFPTTHELNHTLKNLHEWTRPKNVGSSIPLLTTRSKILYQAKGVVLIISPWNFPFNLTFIPLISAIAAGNRVILKPSEITVHASSLMEELINENFSPDDIYLFEGGVDTAKELLSFPFNHIFFTGSPAVGKKVMAAAAQNLSSVTLELGGKSPTIVDDSASIKQAAKSITWSKWVNNGQICIAPDYVLVHRSKKEELLVAIKSNIKKFYGTKSEFHPDYNQIVNKQHHQKLVDWIDEALAQGAKLHEGGKYNKELNHISPTILSHLAESSQLSQEEIFGPVLPLYTFDKIEEAVHHIKKHSSPLVLYIYSKKKKNIRYILDHTEAGGTLINQGLLHYFNPELPFGGVNESGMGKSHGIYGFEEFSNKRALLKQKFGSGIAGLFMPPYSLFKQKIIDFAIRWF